MGPSDANRRGGNAASEVDGEPYDGLDDDGIDDDSLEDDRLVRPFIITGGRTRHHRVTLRVEALVVVTDAISANPLQFEHAQIVELAQAPISVAECSICAAADCRSPGWTTKK